MILDFITTGAHENWCGWYQSIFSLWDEEELRVNSLHAHDRRTPVPYNTGHRSQLAECACVAWSGGTVKTNMHSHICLIEASTMDASFRDDVYSWSKQTALFGQYHEHAVNNDWICHGTQKLKHINLCLQLIYICW